jgi:radical SAM superfamily enzyme YgiQ (UPF0313 family)
MRVVLISTYELGRQPFGLASPAAWLRAQSHQVTCADLSVQALPEDAIRRAGLVAFYLPMHTAARLAVKVIEKVKALNASARLCCYGLYAPLNETYLREIGVDEIIGGEFEARLVELAGGGRGGSVVSLEKLRFLTPERGDLPSLDSYAKLGGSIRSGYTEASRGCKHLCRHCPIVPVYNGAFRVVQPDVVLEDIRRQVAAGAGHITFGDPDFFNGPAHAMRIVESLHSEFPGVTYDATIKIEHLRKHRDLLPALKRTGCLFVTSAAESIDDAVLEKLDKGHTRADFIEAVRHFQSLGLTLAPTFIPFTPWTTVESYRELLQCLLELELAESVSPIQLALRLLIPAGSRLLELEDIRDVIESFDAPALLHRWRHSDPQIDDLAKRVFQAASRKAPRRELFHDIWEEAHGAPPPENFNLIPRAAIPYMDEPWYC